MFLGTYYPRLDEKSRLIFPSKFRSELADGLVMTRGQERCLYIFSTAEFQEVYQKINQAPLTNKQARDYIRVFLSGASDDTMDKQGRVTISQNLREYAGLDRELAVIGSGSHVEIWDKTTWEKYLADKESLFSDVDTFDLPGITL